MQGNRSRSRSLSSERMEAAFDQLIKEYEEQESTSKGVTLEYEVNREGVTVIGEFERGKKTVVINFV